MATAFHSKVTGPRVADGSSRAAVWPGLPVACFLPLGSGEVDPPGTGMELLPRMGAWKACLGERCPVHP